MGDQILDLLLDMARSPDRTLILVTHSHQIAARADRTLTIKECHLVLDAFDAREQAPHLEIGMS